MNQLAVYGTSVSGEKDNTGNLGRTFRRTSENSHKCSEKIFRLPLKSLSNCKDFHSLFYPNVNKALPFLNRS